MILTNVENLPKPGDNSGSQSGSHREPERDRQRARGNQIELEKTRKSHGEPK